MADPDHDPLADGLIAEEPSPLPEPTPPEDILDVMEYVHDDFRRFGFSQLSRVQSIAYFLPLLHEIFGGGEAKTKLTFSILHTLMIDDRVRWSRQELDEIFHWIKEGHRHYLFYRLSNVGWLEYFRDRGVYMISDKGEALMRILSRFVLGKQLVENEGAALAEIEFSLLLDLNDLPDRLRFLRNRLMKHSIRAEHALNSESAYRILEIYEQLKSAYRWAEQTRQTLDHIEVEEDNTDQWDAVRGVHDHLSKLHSIISTMQLTLQDIQRRQIDIAHYGLTHLDIDHYLIHANVDVLSDMMQRHLGKIPHPFLVVEDNMFGEADDILNRDREEAGEGRGWEMDVDEAEADQDPQSARETDELVAALHRVSPKWQPAESIIQNTTWEIAAYRFSILTLLADFDTRMRREARDAMDPIVTTPVEVSFNPNADMVTVESTAGTLSMTKGRVRHLDPESS